MRGDTGIGRRTLMAGLGAACAAPALAQGFAGLGAGAEGFALPQPGVAFDFPRDHGAHPRYRIEWWYVTASLTGADGRACGVQWTLFRSALAAGNPDLQAWMGHAAATTSDRHFVAERLARGGIGQAGVTTDPFEAWIDGWQLTGPDFGNLTMKAAGTEFAYRLSLEADGPLVPQGQDGYSVKSAAGQASYYYSQPFYRARGILTLPDGDLAVTGRAWLDHEWSSQPLGEDQRGWDWFSLHLDSGARLMGFRLRGEENFTAATWITPNGTPTPYPDGAFSAEPLAYSEVAGRRIPTRWRIRLPDRGVDAEVRALNEGAWMATRFPYWEGPVTVSGSHDGRGFLEMTGYE